MNWRNSQFQVLAFLVGKCHTVDEAYRQAKQLREERDVSLRTSQAAPFRYEARKIALDQAMLSGDQVRILEAKAALIEFEATLDQHAACVAECERELAFLDQVIAMLEPKRKYRDLPDHEAFQLAQPEEWYWEFRRRAENYILSHGGIPADQLETMRLHPRWDEIATHIEDCGRAIQERQPLPLTESPLRAIVSPLLLLESEDTPCIAL